MEDRLKPDASIPDPDRALAAGPQAGMGPRVAVFHPGTQRSPYTAWLLDENGLLAWYATGIYYDPARPPRLLSLLPGGFGGALRGELRRRNLPALDPSKVRCLGTWEWVVAAAGRLGLTRPQLSRLMTLRNRSHGRRVGRWLADGPEVLYSYNSVALTAFRAAARRGVRRVLDQTTPTLPVAREILRLEQEVAPPEWWPMVRFDRHGRESEGGLGYARHEDEEAEELALADLVVCGSEFCAASVRRLLGDQGAIRVLPYGVDVSTFTPGEWGDRRGFTVLMVGNLKAEKGLWYLLQAARRARIPDLRVRLVGHQELPPGALAPYEDLITHVPHVPRVEVHRQYQAGDVYVLPTLIEGSSNTVYEAMASGLPVITTPNAGSVVEHGREGFIVPVRDPEAIAGCLRRLHAAPELRRSMGAAARQRALECTWEVYGRRLAELIRGLTEPGR